MTQWQPQKLTLTDDGFALLGNALMLSYRITSIQRRGGIWTEHLMREERLECSERTKLRGALVSAGCYDYRLEHEDGYYGSALQSIAEHDAHLENVLSRDEPINQIRIQDIEVPALISRAYEIESELQLADPATLRLPITRLAPCSTTRKLVKLVMDYFQGRIQPHLLSQLPDKGSVLSGRKTNTSASTADTTREEAQPKRKYNPGFEQSDKRFVQLGVELMRAGEYISVAAAARYLVEKHGTVAPEKAQDDPNAIPTNSPENAAKRLARKISAELKRDQ